MGEQGGRAGQENRTKEGRTEGREGRGESDDMAEAKGTYRISLQRTQYASIPTKGKSLAQGLTGLKIESQPLWSIGRIWTGPI